MFPDGFRWAMCHQNTTKLLGLAFGIPLQFYSLCVAINTDRFLARRNAALRQGMFPGILLISRDCVHGDDVAWVNMFREGNGAIYRLLDNLERFSRMPIRLACSGHGGLITDPQQAFASAIERYERWLADPAKIAWHTCKRIFSYALMIENGLDQEAIALYLLALPWFLDFCRWMLDSEPIDCIHPLIDELLRVRAVQWEGKRLVCATPFNSPAVNWWGNVPTRPQHWGK
jgi:hydroxyacylglutathione hydrolase